VAAAPLSRPAKIYPRRFRMTEFKYAGSELDLFREVRNWKSYWSGEIRPFIAGDVLEVGAGIGSNTEFLDAGGPGQWVCLEPDPELASQLVKNLPRNSPSRHEVVCGTLRSVTGRLFDTIIYIDVLEHIEDDRAELIVAAAHLRPNGRIVVLAPAHQRLFTPFDAAIGHFRRYSRSMLRKISPASLRIERLRYLDCFGLAASTTNLLLLRQSMPTAAQLQFWDRWIIPCSRVFDPVFMYSVGKSVLAVWGKSDSR
jgi:SAM-dependent methyltransferase